MRASYWNNLIGGFTGITFEGNNRTISNLMINRPNATDVGLFRDSFKSTIANLRLLNIDIKGFQNVGGLVGHNTDSSVVGNSVSGSVTGNLVVGV